MSTTIWQYEFVPIKYMDSYLRCMRMNGASEEECELMIAKNNSALEKYPDAPSPAPRQVKYTPIFTDPDTVKVSLRVRKNGSVKLTIINNPYEKLLRHTREGNPVPIESFIQFHKLNGAPNEYLIRTLEKHDARMKAKERDDEKFMKIFDKYTSSSAPAKKKISVVKKLNPVF